jgi:ubiquinone/menaquinone biosynthesis C-methylase UbiE
MPSEQKLWDELHRKYLQAEWIKKPTIFIQEVIRHFPSTGNVLELGVGQGQDAQFLADHGYTVTGLDISKSGLQAAKQKLSSDARKVVTFILGDISRPLPFSNSQFDIVYSHLALHYFSSQVTQQIFDEIERVLKAGGIFAALVNSVHDPEYGSGEKIEDSYFKIRGFSKRFFTAKTIQHYAEKFEIILADENGQTYKDRALGNSNLVQLVARKPIHGKS